MKKTLKIIAILFFLLILFRGFVYRNIIKYNEIGTRQEIKINNDKLIEKINSKSSGKKIHIKEIIEIANEITNEELSFTTNKVTNNPNEIVNTNKANCVGYSTMFNSIANFLIRKNKLQNDIVAKHKIGQLELFGINIHKYFKNPFFKDHDFNEIIDLNSKNKILTDPSLSDYLWIDRITKKE